MSVAGIFSSGFGDYSTQMQQFQQEFQQLGKDLQAGNLTAAEGDFVTLQQDMPQSAIAASSSSTAATTSESESPIAQAFAQLGTDLQAGNLTAAQSDFSAIQQDIQSQAAESGQNAQSAQGAEGHHHHHHGGSDGASSSQGGQLSQLLTQLGQELQSGNLTSAQQTYNSLEQDFQSFAQRSGQASGTSSQSSSSASRLSVSA